MNAADLLRGFTTLELLLAGLIAALALLLVLYVCYRLYRLK